MEISQRTLSLAASTPFWAKADAKVRLFFELPKLFEENFLLSEEKKRYLDKYQGSNPLHLIIYIKRYLLWIIFVTLPSEIAKLLCLGKKRNEFLCFALNFS